MGARAGWPYFKTGLAELIAEAEYAEMRTHGPKIRDDVAGLVREVKGG
jgi:hypothetical protein